MKKSITTIRLAPLDDSGRQNLSKALQLVQWLIVLTITFAAISI